MKIVSELNDQVNLILSKIQLEKQKKLSQDKWACKRVSRL